VCAREHEHEEGKFHCIDMSVDDDENDVCFEQQLMQCLLEEFEVIEREDGEIPICEYEIEVCSMNVPENTKAFADNLCSFAGISEYECNHVEDVASPNVKSMCSTEIATDIYKGIDIEPAVAKEELRHEVLACKPNANGKEKVNHFEFEAMYDEENTIMISLIPDFR